MNQRKVSFLQGINAAKAVPPNNNYSIFSELNEQFQNEIIAAVRGGMTTQEASDRFRVTHQSVSQKMWRVNKDAEKAESKVYRDSEAVYLYKL